MAEEGNERPRKRIVVLSMGSFWWRVIKESLKHSREPFEHITTYLGIVVGAVALLFIFHQIQQERLDRMIYWTLALAFLVWAVWLVWNLIKTPHKIYRTDIGALMAGAEAVIDRKTGFRNFARFFLITVIVGSFIGVFVIKNGQISELQRQLDAKPGATGAKNTELPKPLPDKIIPAPQPPPINIVAQQPPSITATTQQNEIFNSSTNLTEDESDDPLLRLKADKAAQQRAEDEITFKAATIMWRNYLPFYQRILVELHDALKREADKKGDGLEQSAGYFQCLPSTIDINTGQFEVATIGLQNDTNMLFKISISGRDGINHRRLIISCSGGTLTINPGYLRPDSDFYSVFHVNPDFDYTDSCPFTNNANCITKSVNEFIKIQHKFITSQKIK